MASLVLGNKSSDKDFVKGTIVPSLNLSATSTLTTAMSNSNIAVTLAAAAVTVTLPPVSQGLRYRFEIAAAGTTGILTVNAAAGTPCNGSITGPSGILGGIVSAALGVAFPAAPPIGSWMEFSCLDGVSWAVKGAVGGQGTPAIGAVLTAVGTANGAMAAAVDVLAGATAVPALTTLSAHVGFAVPANTLVAGRVARLKCYGIYGSAGHTSTWTPALLFNTAAAATTVGTGVASGTFATAGAVNQWTLEAILTMIDATHLCTSGTLFLALATPATTISGSCGFSSAAAGVVIVPGSAGNICPTILPGTNDAAVTFQCLGGTLEYLN